MLGAQRGRERVTIIALTCRACGLLVRDDCQHDDEEREPDDEETRAKYARKAQDAETIEAGPMFDECPI